MMPYGKPQIRLTRVVLPAHEADLKASAVDITTAALAGVHSIGHPEAYDLGIRGAGDLSGLCFPYWDVTEQAFSHRFIRVKPDARVTDRKYLQPVGERPRLYFIPGTTGAQLRGKDLPVFVVEGEKKALALYRALLQIDHPGLVIGLGGCWAWRRSARELQADGKLGKGQSRAVEDFDWVTWAGRRVFLVFDSDVLTNWKVAAAETALARELRSRGARVSIVRLEASMAKIGIDDLIAAEGPTVVGDLLANAWAFDGRPCPARVHLSDIEDARLGRKRVVIDLMVSAIGEAFLLPKEIQLRCLVTDDSCACAHSQLKDGRWELSLSSPEILIELTKTPTFKLYKIIGGYVASICGNAGYVRALSYQTVTCFLASPRARRVRSVTIGGKPVSLDESGKPYREKVVYYLGQVERATRYYRGIGEAIPNPKSQEATAFLWTMEPLEEDFEGFNVSTELAKRFRVFQATARDASAKLEAIACDVTDHVTQIYGEHRRRALLGKLLTFHSVRQFDFDGERLKRGWVEMVEVGDTGQGKTQQVDRLISATGMGEGVDGVSTTRTGLAYAFLKFVESWFLVWGKYPLNDGKLLFVDEAQNLDAEDIDKIRKGRSDGVITASGVRSGEHPTRTRLIMTCNPRHEGVVDDELFGIELLKGTFKDEDIRRFDLAIITSSSDDKADINTPRHARSVTQRVISDDALADSIRWAWSRAPGDVVFPAETTEAVYEAARVLSSQYGSARDIPLLLESDSRHKIARLAVAAACLLHSTDERHEKVIVRPDHVTAVADFLLGIYTHPNCSFDLYARIRRSEADLSEADYKEIWQHLRTCKVEGDVTLAVEDLHVLLKAFVTHGGQISRQDLAGEMGKSPAWTSKVVRVLKAQQLIRANRGRSGGYRVTPKFNRFLKLAITRKELEP